MTKKRLTEGQFLVATKRLQISKQSLQITHGVLVEGRRHTEFVEKFGITKAAVSQAVRRIWDAADVLPSGFERVSAILPAHQAFIVRKWAARAEEKLMENHDNNGNTCAETQEERRSNRKVRNAAPR
ncbi:TrfB-related DNA-binding protein [Lautropia mirabilis]